MSRTPADTGQPGAVAAGAGLLIEGAAAIATLAAGLRRGAPQADAAELR